MKPPVILGLTGSIAMGKSHTARLFRAYGVPVFDSDAAVHRLFRLGGAAVAPVLAAFPGTGSGSGGIDRGSLGARVLGDRSALRRLEAIVHPLVKVAQRRFIEREARRGTAVVVLDVPLLLETGGERRVDGVVVVSAPAFLQRQRALRRPGMTPQRLTGILAKQMPDPAKRRLADFVIQSGSDRGRTANAVRDVVRATCAMPATAWPARWLTSEMKEERR